MHRLLLLLMSLLLGACSAVKKDSSVVSSATSKASETGLGKFQGGYKMVKDPDTGFSKPVSTRSGPFGEGQSAYFQNQSTLKKKAALQKTFETKRWSGEKKALQKRWGQAEQKFQHSPQFIKENAHLTGRRASYADRDYGRESFRTKSALEQSGKRLKKQSDALVDKRRRVFIQPQIISNEQYQQSEGGRSVEDVKQLLNGQ